MGTFYEQIFSAFNKAGVKYLVAGGVAINLHGIPRTTMDLDLAILLEPTNVRKTTKTLSDLGYEPRVPVDPSDLADAAKRHTWKIDKNMKVFSFTHKKYLYQVIDLFIDLPIPFEVMEKEKIIVDYLGLDVPIVGRHHLKQMKMEVGRAQDLSDVRALDILEKEEEKDAKG